MIFSIGLFSHSRVLFVIIHLNIQDSNAVGFGYNELDWDQQILLVAAVIRYNRED